MELIKNQDFMVKLGCCSLQKEGFFNSNLTSVVAVHPTLTRARHQSAMKTLPNYFQGSRQPALEDSSY